VTKFLSRAWGDDCGALISIEFVFIVTILVIGLITGWVAIRNSLTTELEEVANALNALSQDYSFGGLVLVANGGTIASTEGSQFQDGTVSVVINTSAAASTLDSSGLVSLGAPGI